MWYTRMVISGVIQGELRGVANRERAVTSVRFFKTGTGEYGEGDLFLGVTMPELRRIAKRNIDATYTDVVTLLAGAYHEERMVGLLILTYRFEGASERERERIVRFYLRHSRSVNNWDLVDVSAPTILGAHLRDRPHERAVLYRLARSNVLWERRMAMVSTLAFIRAGDFEDACAIAVLLLDDPEDLLHKAVGWMLREVGKADRPTLVRFLEQYACRLPRTALRYAIEHFKEVDRKAYLALPRCG